MKKMTKEAQNIIKNQGVELWSIGTDIDNYFDFLKNNDVKKYFNNNFLVKITNLKKIYGDDENANNIYSLNIIDKESDAKKLALYKENLSISTYNQIVNVLLGLKIIDLYKDDSYKFNTHFSKIIQSKENLIEGFKEYIKFYIKTYSKPYLFDVIDNAILEEKALFSSNEDIQVVRMLTNIYVKFDSKESNFIDFLKLKAKNINYFEYFYNEYFKQYDDILILLNDNLSSFYENYEVKDYSWVKKKVEDFKSWSETYRLMKELDIEKNALSNLIEKNAREQLYKDGKPIFAHLFSLGEILNDGTKFYVPSFQRVYMWNGYLVEELIENIYSSLQNKNKTNKEQYAFFNNIILSFSRTNVEILDGQQRLMTFIILLTVLLKLSLVFLDAFREEEYILDNEDYQNLLLFRDFYYDVVYKRRIDELKSNLETGDSENFNTIHSILGDFNTRGDNNYINNAIELSKVISSYFYKLDLNGLKRFSEFVIFTLKNVKFTTTIFTEIYDNPTEKINIFKNINLHSKELSVLDLVKSSLITYFDNYNLQNKNISIETIVNLNKNIFDKYFRKNQKETKDADMNLLELFYNSIYVSNNWFAEKRVIEDKFSISKNSIIYNKFEELTSKINATIEDDKYEEFYFIFFKKIVYFEFARTGHLNNLDSIVNKTLNNGLTKEQIKWFNDFKSTLLEFPVLSYQIYNLTNDGNSKVFTPLIFTILNKFNFFNNEIKDIKKYVAKISKLIYELERFEFLWKNTNFAGESLGKKIIELSKVFLDKGQLEDIKQIDDLEFESKLKLFRDALFNIHPELRSSLYINPETGEYRSNEVLREKLNETYNNHNLEKSDLKINNNERKILLARINSFIVNDYNKFENEFTTVNKFDDFKTNYGYESVINKTNLELDDPNEEYNEKEIMNYIHKIGNGALFNEKTIKAFNAKNSKLKETYKVSENNLILFGDNFKLDKNISLSQLNTKDLDEFELLNKKIKINNYEAKEYFDNINKRSDQIIDILMELFGYKD
ncbi:DUF262 domain-containing protein [Mycoplasma sp. CSL10166]|uniref:DUF262 domain-containing protein n=1 Tax=Mycoplasma sp. CSL10166 TaxID=2813825 RepID=UPI00197B7F30|nr:DUF262 domain-containing protein [Mycoplasma sp. CSL10166]MBN4084407.1 DUF262 domain-containing protein [Mycoplasma sp. CSL10166]